MPGATPTGRARNSVGGILSPVSPRRRHVLLMSLLVAGLLGVFLVGNGRVPLFDRDEPRYAVTSRAMLETGDWVVPRFLGEVRTAKPPAIYWLQAAAMREGMLTLKQDGIEKVLQGLTDVTQIRAVAI